jgi:3-(3-hydroxy-phenyl)propionate hydroxylase
VGEGAGTPPLDVVVVGAGPVGLALALGLARGGRRVLVLEKEAGTAEHSRAPAIWPRTQEVLASLGVIERFLAEGIALPCVALADADRGDRALVEIPLAELAGVTPYPQLLIVPQSDTERLLLAAVREHPGAEVQFSAEVTGVEQHASGVRVTWRRPGSAAPEVAEAAFAAGCDGARSTVRHALGASFDGTTYRVQAALADVDLDPPQDLPFPRLTTRGGLAIGIRIDRRLWRLILPFAAEDGLALEERVERAVRHLFPRAERYDTVWQSEFRLHRRVSSRFVDGRIALAGDAAHLNSPVGGQGMNAGLQDAAALSESLLAALERDDPAPLAGYERQRRRAVESGVNPFTDRLTRLLLFAGGRLIRPLLAVASLALRLPPLRRRFLRRAAMLDSLEPGRSTASSSDSPTPASSG